MVKDTKYIIKRIIIGVGVALVLMLIKGNLILNVQAQDYNAQPNNILISTRDGSNQYSVTSNTWGGQTVFSFPTSVPIDWPSGTSIYFRYPQQAGNTICSNHNNKATLTGRLYNSSSASGLSNVPVFYEDTTSGGYHGCSTSVHSNYIDFICNNFPTNHGFNIQVQSATQGRWGIAQQFDISCIISGDDITSNINAQSNQNTQTIINNDNANTDKIIESTKVCSLIDKNKISINNKYLDSTGNEVALSTFGITDYISVNGATIKALLTYEQNWNIYSCYYNVNKTLISCTKNNSLSETIPSGASYVRLSINKELNKPQFQLCANGNQAIIDNQNNNFNDLQQQLTDSDISQSQNDFQQHYNETHVNFHSFERLLTLPLNFLNSFLTDNTCNPLSFDMPFTHNKVELPCIKPIFQQHFPLFLNLYQIIVSGLIAYRVGINFLGLIKKLLTADDDKVEVLDL